MRFRNILFMLVLTICAPQMFASGRPQLAVGDSSLPQLSHKRLITVLGSESVVYAGSLIGLNALWYKDYPRSAFHTFNDANEWLQMDKCGHATTSYTIGRIGIGLLRWSGVKEKKAIWFGGILGSVYQTTIEILDGYSAKWGFSWSDVGANTAGSLLCIGQELAWKQQRIQLKYSYHSTVYPLYRPNVLGSTFTEQWLKDYNGQSYWLSFNLASFMRKDTRFPSWLNLAVGYGAEGMTGGAYNPPYIDGKGKQVYFDRYRQFYLSFDADLSRIKTKSKFLHVVLQSFGVIKLPAPALVFSKHGVTGNWWGF